MKALPFLLLRAVAVCGILATCTSGPERSLPTVTHVDLSRYAGKWYEAARLPNAFQRDDSNATAEYSLLPGEKVRVVNTEYRPDGSTHVAEGTATAVADGSNSRLKVRFKGFAALAPVPKEGNYWIIRLESDYSAVMVGTPNRKYLWILSRQPHPPQAVMEKYLHAAEVLEFDTGKLRRAKWETLPKRKPSTSSS